MTTPNKIIALCALNRQLRRSLDAERDAHELTRLKLGVNEQHLDRLRDEIDRLRARVREPRQMMFGEVST